MPDPKSSRPQRFSILDSLGRKKTIVSAERVGPATGEALPIGTAQTQSMAHAFDCYALGKLPCLPKIIIFLGLGPQPELLPKLAAEFGPVEILYCECSAFSSQMLTKRRDWQASIPEQWRAQSPAQVADLLQQAKDNANIALRVYCYRQNLSLFPEFWGPVLGQLNAALLLCSSEQRPLHPQARTIVLPGQPGALLFAELTHAIRECGYQPLPLWEENPELPVDSPAFQQCLAKPPAAFLSVNLRGLDALGKRFYLLEAMGVPVALWFVDNPWLILSALRSPWWKQATLFVTDPSFVPGLLACGATKVEFLPLGASPACMKPEKAAWSGELQRLCFVGSTAFREHRAYFAAAQQVSAVHAQALQVEERFQNPGFHWWAAALGLTPQNLWPGTDVRQAGMGAQAAGLRLRTRWLKAALPYGLSVFGDVEWAELLGTPTHGPVDYYHQVPALYQQAEYILDIPTLLLPQALNQRHFDVWQAGGFLLSVPNPGLDLFPAELTSPICVPTSEHLQVKLEQFTSSPAQKIELQHAWQEELRKHTYQDRIQSLLHRLAQSSD